MKILMTTLLALHFLVLMVGCTGNEDTHAHADQEGHAAVHSHQTSALCAAHDAPIDLCFLCDPALREEGRLWCQGHGRYEDRCWSCQPHLRDPERAYCEKHGLYEDECHLCDPARQGTHTASTGVALQCLEHDLLESECGICHPELAASLRPGEEMMVRLPSERSAELAEVIHSAARVGSAAGVVTGYAEIEYDRNRLARVSPRVSGVIMRVLVDVGETVTAGAPLLEVASTELAQAKQNLLDARLDLELKELELERARRLHDQEIGSDRTLQSASSLHKRAAARAAAAAQNMRNLGLDQETIARIAESDDTSGQLVIRAPFDGQVIERTAVLGESVTPEAHLMSIADLSRMWLELSFPQSALTAVEEGLPVIASFDALPGREVSGMITWVGAGLDQRTRLLRARAEVANPDGRLKAGLYGRAEIHPSLVTEALTLPLQAIYDLDQQPYILVRRSDSLYALRRVETGARQGTSVAILAGLGEGETVITGGGFSVFSELLKSRFGAGCAEE